MSRIEATIFHEAGHAVVADRLGCNVIAARAESDGGEVTYGGSADPLRNAAVNVAGGLCAAMHGYTSEISDSDRQYTAAAFKQHQEQHPEATIGEFIGQAVELARKTLADHPEEVRRFADHLRLRGRLAADDVETAMDRDVKHVHHMLL